jgi:glutamyl-tRNA reductase
MKQFTYKEIHDLIEQVKAEETEKCEKTIANDEDEDEESKEHSASILRIILRTIVEVLDDVDTILKRKANE